MLFKIITFLLFVAGAFGQEELSQDVWSGASDSCWYNILNGTAGWCENTDCCEGNYVISGICPSYPNAYKCCFSRNTCGLNGGCGTCNDATAQEYACKILAMYEFSSGDPRKIYLKPDHFNSLGNNPYDGASVLSNIRDTCMGKQVRRSSYCDGSCAPGGCVCLKGKMLEALYNYANTFYNTFGQPAQINSIAGGVHSSNSYHYTGNTFDMACTTPLNHCTSIVNHCRNYGAIEMCYPGSACGGHETWVHCAF